MNWLFIIIGSVGLGYGISTLLRNYIEIYSIPKRRIVEYKGLPAQIVSSGIILASLATLAIAIIGYVAWPFMFVVAVAYYGGFIIANRIVERENK